MSRGIHSIDVWYLASMYGTYMYYGRYISHMECVMGLQVGFCLSSQDVCRGKYIDPGSQPPF